MMMNLRQLVVNRLIAHDVPKRLVKGGGESMTLTQAESPLDPELRDYIQQRITGSLQSAGTRVESDPDTESPVPALILDRLGDGSTEFVSMSQVMAQHLHMSQTGVNPAGVLCVAEVVMGTTPGLATLKLDRAQGVLMNRQTDIRGRFMFDLEHLRDLILTNRSRVFKIGLFGLQDDPTVGIQGLVSDNQRSYSSQTDVAPFFLETFLGCRYIESPEIVTREILFHTERFIATQIEDSESQARYTTGLYAEMNNEENSFSPVVFAQRNFRIEDREPYRQWLLQHDVEPRTFTKNTQLIGERLKKVTMSFASGTAVIYHPDALGDSVQVTDVANGLTRVEIEDELRGIQGRSP